MSEASAGAGRGGQPMAVQLISLLVAGWVITLLVTAAVVLLLPQPQQAVYRLSELVAAANGGSLVTRDGRKLVRVRQAEPPQRGEERISNPMYTFILASALGQPAARIRLERYPMADPVQRALVRALLASPPRGVGPPGVMSAPAYGPPIGPPDPFAAATSSDSR